MFKNFLLKSFFLSSFFFAKLSSFKLAIRPVYSKLIVLSSIIDDYNLFLDEASSIFPDADKIDASKLAFYLFSKQKEKEKAVAQAEEKLKIKEAYYLKLIAPLTQRYFFYNFISILA
jgi:hypothetical protein